MAVHFEGRRTRRDVLRLGVAGAAGLCAGGLGLLRAQDVPPVAAKKDIPIALQLYSVRGECEKEKGKNLKPVVEAVAKMGYAGVEFAGYYGWKVDDLRKLLDDNKLKCVGTHTGLDALLGDSLKKTMEFHKTLGCPFIIVPGMGGKYTESIQAWKDTAKLFNEIAEKLKGEGLSVGYHNHGAEFKAVDGVMPWDAFFGSTSKDVIMQLDIGNGMDAGADPVAIMKKYPGVVRSMHVKEHGGGPKAVIGDGDVPWKEIIALARTTANTQVFVIEHERSGQDPMEAVEKCLVNFKKLLA
jgi:sugar phosphate isomerase/epimerase